MKSLIHLVLGALLLIAAPISASAQFGLIQEIPGQSDDDFGTNGYQPIQAANGDVLVFLAKNGEITDSNFPVSGDPAHLILYRTSDGGESWADPVAIDTAIALKGPQGLGSPRATVLASGQILLTYWYLEAAFPNYSLSVKMLTSSDNGLTWTQLADKPSESTFIGVSPDGQVVSADWVDDGNGNLSFHSSTYDVAQDTWTDTGLIMSSDPVCTQTVHVTSDTEWEFYYADCVFGGGGTNHVFRSATSDGGATWTAAAEVFTAASGYGTFGSVVDNDGGLMAVYHDGGDISYRTSGDGGATWSDGTQWTGGTPDTGDLSPTCSPAPAGPVCAFLARRGTQNQLIHVGNAGVSGDPQLGATAVESDEVPGAFDLLQGYPNPFSTTATIDFGLHENAYATLRVYNALGVAVAELANGFRTAGQHSVNWDATLLPAGLYFYRLTVDGVSSVRQMTLVQ